MRFILRILKSFLDDDCFNLSYAISFCALLALIPLTMIMVSVAGYFLGSQGAIFNQIVDATVGVLPIGKDIFVSNMQAIMKKSSSLGIAGLISLFVIATVLVASIERAFDIVFRTVKRRNFFHSRLIGVAIIFGIALLFFIPTMVGVFDVLLQRFGLSFPLTGFFTAGVFMFVMPFLAFVVVSVVVPNQKVYIRYAMLGGVVFSLGIGAAKLLFKWYISFALARYNLIYGSFTAAILLLMWIYYISNILLLSVEVVANVQDSRKGLESAVSI